MLFRLRFFLLFLFGPFSSIAFMLSVLAWFDYIDFVLFFFLTPSPLASPFTLPSL